MRRLYTIDPRGLVAGQDLGDEQVETAEWQNHMRETQDSLRVLAEQTGGIAVVNQNDFDKALKRIDAETSDYYVLGYYSTNPDPLKRTRRIEVKTKRNGVQVWSRTSYSLRPSRRLNRCRGAARLRRTRGRICSNTRITSDTVRGNRLIFG